MASETPRVSVVIPLFNGENFVERVLHSVLAQDYGGAVEIVVVDDGSSDQSFQVAERIVAGRPLSQLVRQENSGVAAARNRGLELSRGELVAFLDQDDQWDAGYLSAMVGAIRHSSGAAAAFAAWRDVDAEGHLKPAVAQITEQSWWTPRSGDVLPWVAGRRISIISMSVALIDAAALRAIGGFDPATVPCDDWDMWLRLAQKYPIVYCDQKLASYCWHDGQQTRARPRVLAAKARVIRKNRALWRRQPALLGEYLNLLTLQRTFLDYLRARSLLQTGERAKFWRRFAAMTLKWPFILLSRDWLYLVVRALRGTPGDF